MSRQQKVKRIPHFKSETGEREFWETTDSTDFVDWSEARIGLFPDLKPSTETISLRLPAGLLAELKALANQRDVPYQSLLKIFLAERIALERGHKPRRTADNRKKLPDSRATSVAERPRRYAGRRSK